jgi:hypothetical protein
VERADGESDDAGAYGAVELRGGAAAPPGPPDQLQGIPTPLAVVFLRPRIVGLGLGACDVAADRADSQCVRPVGCLHQLNPGTSLLLFAVGQ